MPPHKILLFLLMFFVVIVISPIQSAGHKPKLNLGPRINVTKHLSFPNFNPSNPQDIALLGSAAISSENGCIQIPGDNLQYSAGRALYSSPIRLLDPNTKTPASFRTTFSFRIHSIDYTTGGFGFIIVPDEFTVGRPGPWLGMMNDACEDEYKIVGIEFDTRMNPEFGDPNDNHIGINLGSIVSSKTADAGDVGIDLNDEAAHRAWITYDGATKFFQIHLGPDTPTLPTRAVYSGNLDLSPYLNEYMFIGFSGSTGNNRSQINSICSWNFTSISQASLRVPSPESCARKIIVSDEYQNIPSKAPDSFYIFLAVVALILIMMITLYFNRKRKGDTNNNSDEIAVIRQEEASLTPPNRARKFTLAEIQSATRGFNELQILGSDSRSVTYKGTLFNGCYVAVKRYSPEIFGHHGFDKRRMTKEVKAIGKIRHPNMVPIRGWCFDNQEFIVLYEFEPNGSLDKWMIGFGVLPWIRRYKIIKDVAEALSSLHSKGLAHKNVKPSSVFLDISFRAILGDFGFVLAAGESNRFEAAVSQKVDVFEFGVLVVEVVSGRARGSDPGALDLAWAMQESGEKEKLVDRRMGQGLVVNPEQAVRVLEVGLLCTLNDNKGRPTMEEVVEYLNGEKPVPELPRTRPVSLFPYSSATVLCSGYTCRPFK